MWVHSAAYHSGLIYQLKKIKEDSIFYFKLSYLLTKNIKPLLKFGTNKYTSVNSLALEIYRQSSDKQWWIHRDRNLLSCYHLVIYVRFV